MKRLFGGLLVVLVLLVGADIIARVAAERELSSTLESRLELDSSPDVSISGFSVLIQAVTGTYDEVTVSANGVPTENIGELDYKLSFRDIDLPLSDVISKDIDTVTAASATAEVRVPESALSDLMGSAVTVESGDGDALVLSAAYEIGGTTLDLSVTASVTVEGEQVHVDIHDVSAEGASVPQSAVSAISDALDVSFPLPPAIRGLSLTGVSAQDGAVVLHAEGSDVPLNGE